MQMFKVDVGKTVLLVEDNQDDIDLTLHCFKQNRIANKIMVAPDGVEAIEYLFGEGRHAGRNVDDVPALVLLDLNLPKLNGLEVLQRIRANPRTKRVPVVILTSSKEEQDLIKGYDEGANSYIRKPVDLDQFNEAIKQLGLYWLILNELPPPEK